MKVLLGVTGSVATVFVGKLVDALHASGHEVEVVATKSSLYFLDPRVMKVRVWKDEDEWPDHGQDCDDVDFIPGAYVPNRSFVQYKKGQLIPHIDLRKWADVFLVAPLDANTLAKFSIGLCDNLLTCVFRAWDFDKPVVLAPAMNTFMWHNPWTEMQMNLLSRLQGSAGGHNVHFVDPQSKVLACGDEGIGAMADISKIVDTVNKLDKTKTADSVAPTSK